MLELNTGWIVQEAGI